jgi:hypothetical protein
MALKIKKALHDELLKIKRQKKGISSYLIGKGYSKSWAANVSKNWATLEIIGGPANVSTKKTPVKSSKSKTKKIATSSTPSAEDIQHILNTAEVPDKRVYIGPSAAKEATIVQVVQEPEKELVVNISQGFEVVAEVRVRQLSHSKFFLASLVKILQKTGAKVTFNAGLDLANSSETLDGFTLAINEDHEALSH